MQTTQDPVHPIPLAWQDTPDGDGPWWLSFDPSKRPPGESATLAVDVDVDDGAVYFIGNDEQSYLDTEDLLIGAKWARRAMPADPFCKPAA